MTKEGEITVTEDQVKKHYTQMSEEELDLIESSINQLKPYEIKVSKHLQKKLAEEIKMNTIAIVKMLNTKEYKVIEYNTTRGDKRVLLRGTETHMTKLNGKEQKANICVVISLLNKRLVTAYFNSESDNHSTLDLRRYNPYLEVALGGKE